MGCKGSRVQISASRPIQSPANWNSTRVRPSHRCEGRNTMTIAFRNRSIATLAAALCLATLASAAADKPPSVPKAVAAAVADPARPQADRDRDADRKPAECIAFAGLKPGDHIADLIPGGGYFTRIFSGVVGPKGEVFAVSPPKRPDAPADR